MSVQIHRCRFLDSQTSGVRAVGFNTPNTNTKLSKPEIKLAVGRANGDIEIYDPLNWTLLSTFTSGPNQTVDGIVFKNNRLFSINGSDSVLEHDFATLTAKQSVRSDAGLIWSIAAHPHEDLIAVSTENGVVVVFSMEDELTPVARLQSEVTSLSCVAFCGPNLVACGGTDGVVRVFDYSQKRQVATMRTKKSKNEELVIWSIAFNPKFNQLATTDSEGCVSIWDLGTNSLLQNIRAHQGDALSVVFTNDYTSLRTSGLDQKIVLLTNIKQNNRLKWTLMSSTVTHSSDVRCLANANLDNCSLLVSGGQDGAVGVHRSNRPVRNFPPPSQSKFVVCNELVFEFNELEVKGWLVADRSLKYHIKLLDSSFITSMDVDPALGLLAVATLTSLRLFLIEENEVSLVHEQEMSIKSLKFAESEKLVLHKSTNELQMLNTESMELSLLSDDVDGQLLAASATHVVLANGPQMQLFNLETNEFLEFLSVDSLVVTAELTNNSLVCVTANKHIHEFSLQTLQLTKWSRENKQNVDLQQQLESPTDLFVNNDQIWVYAPSYLFGCTTSKPLRDAKVVKKFKNISFCEKYLDGILVCEKLPQQVQKLETNRRIYV